MPGPALNAYRAGGWIVRRSAAGVHSYAILPIGYPMRSLGPVGRGKLEDIVFQDRWGQPYAVA